MTDKLRQAAQAVIDRLTNIESECVTEMDFHIANCQWLESIEALRQALADHIPDTGKMVYTPMTDDVVIESYAYADAMLVERDNEQH